MVYMSDLPSRARAFNDGVNHWQYQQHLYNGRGDTVHWASDTRNPERWNPGAEAHVSAPRTRYIYGDSGSSVQQSDEYVTQHIGSRESDGQGALFGVTHTHPEMHWLVSHPDMRGHVPTMLGIAALETHARYGEYPRPADNLSDQSTRMVEKLASVGATKMPSHIDWNPMSSEDHSDRGPDLAFVRRDAAEGSIRMHDKGTASVGRQFIRSVLRGPKRSVPPPSVTESTKGKQQKLFGE